MKDFGYGFGWIGVEGKRARRLRGEGDGLKPPFLYHERRSFVYTDFSILFFATDSRIDLLTRQFLVLKIAPFSIT